MIKITLEEELKRIIDDVKQGKLDKRITSWKNYESNYVFTKDTVEVSVQLKSGKEAKIDISDYFFEKGK